MWVVKTVHRGKHERTVVTRVPNFSALVRLLAQELSQGTVRCVELTRIEDPPNLAQVEMFGNG